MNDSNQNVKIILITAIICIVLCIPLGLLIGRVLFYNNDSSNMSNNIQDQTNSEANNITNGDSNNSESNRQVCEGFKDAIYEGEYHKTDGNISHDEYLTLTLKKDGTFIASYKDSEENIGNYTISNNVLTTTFCPNYQPCDEKIVLSYDITSDCSTIMWGEPEYYQYNIYLK